MRAGRSKYSKAKVREGADPKAAKPVDLAIPMSRAHVEHVFAGHKHRVGLVVRTIGIARARIKIGLANLAYNFQRLTWLEGRTAPA
jgi:hypothetical protein